MFLTSMKEQMVSANSNKRQRDDMAASSPRFKGVVLQQNGNWGAQIYANHQKIWLGTFKTRDEAAMAYDTAAIKLQRGDPQHNFQWNNLTIQDLHTTKAILEMVKDGSYQFKFTDSITIHSSNTKNKEKGRVNEQVILCQQIFCKKLTQSDVGKLNRLVIPKKHALTYFPLVANISSKEGENQGKVEAIELTIFDRQLKSWKFRYCYWKSSRSYVLTKGWNQFVKINELKENNTINFYMCEYKDDCKDRTFPMIDVHHSDDESSGFIGRKMELKSGFSGEVGYGSDGKGKREEEGIKLCGGIMGKKVELQPGFRRKNDYMTEKQESQGIRLFGVQIK